MKCAGRSIPRPVDCRRLHARTQTISTLHPNSCFVRNNKLGTRRLRVRFRRPRWSSKQPMRRKTVYGPVKNIKTYSGDQKLTIPANQVGATIRVRGTYIEFDVRSSDFAVFNYRHTGADSPRADKNLPIGPAGVTIFQSKIPLHGKTLTSPVSLEISQESLVLERNGGGQDMKIQAKDCQQGGLFQMEPEPGTRERNTLGDGFVYTNQPPGEQRLCFTNGRVPG